MDNSSNDYHISFFKPTTPQAKTNRNMVLWLVIVWFVAIFGFQILLRIIEKPTPEPVYTAFTNAWANIENGSAAYTDYRAVGGASLSVLGKLFITPEEKVVLNNALSNSLFELTPDSLQKDLIASIQKFEKLQEEITDINDSEYINSKNTLSMSLGTVLGLSDQDVRKQLLPLELVSANIEKLTEESKTQIPGILEKYLVHNRSALTDFTFLGFPFHYFYTAVFLLILFVGLCWIYCVRTDKLNSKFEIVD